MAQPPTLNTERLQFLHLVSASRATLKTTRPARLCPELLEVGVRLREEGWRGREDPRTRGEDERVSGGRKSSSGVWLETQKVIRMELSSPIRVRWLLEQQTPPKSCFNPGRSLLALRTAWRFALLHRVARGPGPLSRSPSSSTSVSGKGGDPEWDMVGGLFQISPGNGTLT